MCFLGISYFLAICVFFLDQSISLLVFSSFPASTLEISAMEPISSFRLVSLLLLKKTSSLFLVAVEFPLRRLISLLRLNVGEGHVIDLYFWI